VAVIRPRRLLGAVLPIAISTALAVGPTWASAQSTTTVSFPPPANNLLVLVGQSSCDPVTGTTFVTWSAVSKGGTAAWLMIDSAATTGATQDPVVFSPKELNGSVTATANLALPHGTAGTLVLTVSHHTLGEVSHPGTSMTSINVTSCLQASTAVAGDPRFTG
jgi:hypothetical protein